jgi:hypothetical protein
VIKDSCRKKKREGLNTAEPRFSNLSPMAESEQASQLQGRLAQLRMTRR